jgi:hypothetical protein
MIFADRQKFSLVLQNLISRAIEVSLEKQEVDAFVSIVDVKPPKLASSTSRSVHRTEIFDSFSSIESRGSRE